MRKKGFVLSAVILCISVVAYLAVTTRICGGDNGYGRFDRDYHLEEGEILHGKCTFYKEGLAPIRISKVSLVNERDIPVEVNVFFCDRQGLQMSGGPINAMDFEKFYGKNLKPLSQLKWLNTNEDFQIAVSTKEDKIDGVWIEIEYRVLGIFPKKIRSQELII